MIAGAARLFPLRPVSTRDSPRSLRPSLERVTDDRTDPARTVPLWPIVLKVNLGGRSPGRFPFREASGHHRPALLCRLCRVGYSRADPFRPPSAAAFEDPLALRSRDASIAGIAP